MNLNQTVYGNCNFKCTRTIENFENIGTAIQEIKK